MAGLIINNSYLQQHPLWQNYNTTLQEIAERDYPGESYFSKMSRVDAIDLDKFEASQHKNSMDSTADATIGIALDKVENKFINSAYLIVELRMGYKSLNNLSLEELNKKIDNSKSILNKDTQSCKIYESYYFIFTDSLAPQAKNYISRLVSGSKKSKKFCVVSVSDFETIMIDHEKLPYKPTHSQDEIEKSFNIKTLKNDFNIDVFSKSFYYWLSLVKKYKYNNKLSEVQHIRNVLSLILENVKTNRQFTEDEYIGFSILEEDLR